MLSRLARARACADLSAVCTKKARARGTTRKRERERERREREREPKSLIERAMVNHGRFESAHSPARRSLTLLPPSLSRPRRVYIAEKEIKRLFGLVRWESHAIAIRDKRSPSPSFSLSSKRTHRTLSFAPLANPHRAGPFLRVLKAHSSVWG